MKSRVAPSRNMRYKKRSDAQPGSRRMEKRLERNRKSGKSVCQRCVNASALVHFYLILSVSFEKETQPVHTDCKPKLCSFRFLNVDSLIDLNEPLMGGMTSVH